jgi:hypothetical protein
MEIFEAMVLRESLSSLFTKVIAKKKDTILNIGDFSTKN